MKLLGSMEKVIIFHISYFFAIVCWHFRSLLTHIFHWLIVLRIALKFKFILLFLLLYAFWVTHVFRCITAKNRFVIVNGFTFNGKRMGNNKKKLAILYLWQLSSVFLWLFCEFSSDYYRVNETFFMTFRNRDKIFAFPCFHIISYIFSSKAKKQAKETWWCKNVVKTVSSNSESLFIPSKCGFDFGSSHKMAF